MNCERKSICAIEGALRWNSHKNKKQANKQEKTLLALQLFSFILIYLFFLSNCPRCFVFVCIFFFLILITQISVPFYTSCPAVCLSLCYYSIQLFITSVLLFFDLKHMWTLYSASLLVVKIKQKKKKKRGKMASLVNYRVRRCQFKYSLWVIKLHVFCTLIGMSS